MQVSKSKLDEQLREALTVLADTFPDLSFRKDPPVEFCEKAARVLYNHLGFQLERRSSEAVKGQRGIRRERERERERERGREERSSLP